MIGVVLDGSDIDNNRQKYTDKRIQLNYYNCDKSQLILYA